VTPPLNFNHTQTHSDVIMQALEWQVTFWSGEVTADERRAFQQWHDADRQHADTWSQLQKTDSKLATLAMPGATHAIRNARQTASRRKALGIFGLFVGTGIVINGIRHTPQWHIATADYRTSHGERREVALPDGTQITMNTATAIDVAFDDAQRLVRIRSGEIFVVTAKDTLSGAQARPFLVQTSEGTVRPIGTRFNVRQGDGYSSVAVSEGAVEINLRSGTGQPTLLKAGQQTCFNEHDIGTIEATPTTNQAWMRGLLVAERMRLEDFLVELGRYRHGFLRCDPAVADLIVSGVYATDDTDKALASLVEALPIRAQYMSRFWVTIQARQ
jgi:transmembrane sensor